jgi:hypothetical protein
MPTMAAEAMIAWATVWAGALAKLAGVFFMALVVRLKNYYGRLFQTTCFCILLISNILLLGPRSVIHGGHTLLMPINGVRPY